VKQTGYLLSCKTSSIAISNHTAGTLTDSGSMGFGKDMQNCIQTVIWYTQSAKATTAPIGSTLKLPGGVSWFIQISYNCVHQGTWTRTNIHWSAVFLNCRRTDQNTYQPTTWQIRFNLDSVSPNSNYKFRVALASSANAELQVVACRTNPQNLRSLICIQSSLSTLIAEVAP
jgi:hypothetical protein